MNYRRWSHGKKIVYWLSVAGLMAIVCFVVTAKTLTSSSASPVSGADTSTFSGAGGSGLGVPHSGASSPDGQPGSVGTRTTVTTTLRPSQGATEPSTAPPSTLAVPKKTLVATLNGDVPGSPSPGAAPTQTVPGSWFGYPSILPVVATEPNWLDVRLAQRPNESTAWIPASDAHVSVDHFAVVVDLATMQLSVFKHGRQLEDFPAGIGKPTSPTPPGSFFVTMKVPPPSPGYGPFVLVTSDHSDTFTDWEDSGDAIIAIHGPIDAHDDALIGTTGAAISNGCVRLHDADLAQLSNIPPGTPVDIVAN